MGSSKAASTEPNRINPFTLGVLILSKNDAIHNLVLFELSFSTGLSAWLQS